ncbi:hypothetical protein [Dyadobacter psychrophilus]|nr:hypothetical protein [Dyadobacter psychrophilus]
MQPITPLNIGDKIKVLDEKLNRECGLDPDISSGYITYVYGDEVSLFIYARVNNAGEMKFRCKLSLFGQYFKLHPSQDNSKAHRTTKHYQLQYPNDFREKPKSY